MALQIRKHTNDHFTVAGYTGTIRQWLAGKRAFSGWDG